MPALAPMLSPEWEWVLPPSGVGLLLPAPELLGEEVVEGGIVDVMVLLLDVKTVTEALLESVEIASVEVEPDVAVVELFVLEVEELSSLLVELELCGVAVDPAAVEEVGDAAEEVGVWPASN